jgi:hypothetical protein
MAYAPPLPGDVGEQLAAKVGKLVIDGALEVAPIAVPFILALAAIAWVMQKFGLTGAVASFAAAGEQRRLAAEHHANEERRARRKARAAARKQAAWNEMHDDALAMNRRRNVRKRLTGSYSRESDF